MCSSDLEDTLKNVSERQPKINSPMFKSMVNTSTAEKNKGFNLHKCITCNKVTVSVDFNLVMNVSKKKTYLTSCISLTSTNIKAIFESLCQINH